MKLALIPPVSLLEYTAETSCQLMLPQLVNNEQYAYTYRQHCEDPDQFVILDNGLAEDAQVNSADLINIAVDFSVDEVVIPDTMYDATRTQEQATDFAQRLRKIWPDEGWPFKLQFVAQGHNRSSVERSMRWAENTRWIDTIALPRHLLETCNDIAIRHKLCLQPGSKPIHLLGGAPVFPNEMQHEFDPRGRVRSHDTSSAFYFAYEKQPLNRPVPVGIKRPENYFDLPAEDFQESYVDLNVSLLMEWTGNDL